MLFAMCQELRKQKLTIPRDMATNMMALHSYILARAYVKKNDHVLSARLLLRVSEHISKFPARKKPTDISLCMLFPTLNSK